MLDYPCMGDQVPVSFVFNILCLFLPGMRSAQNYSHFTQFMAGILRCHPRTGGGLRFSRICRFELVPWFDQLEGRYQQALAFKKQAPCVA
jgi:hypothetical protein